MMKRALLFAAALAGVFACEGAGRPRGGGGPAPSSGPSVAPSTSAGAMTLGSSAASTSAVVASSKDAGRVPAASASAPAPASKCVRTSAPVDLGRSGAVALEDGGPEVRVVRNKGGAPDVVKLPKAPKPGDVLLAPEPLAELPKAPCAVAGKYTYCEDNAGIIRAYDGNVPAPFVLSAVAVPGYRISAAPLGAKHSLLTYLAEANTTEGKMLQAFAVLDHGKPARVSDDGAGATVSLVAPRGEDAVIVSFDARAAMMPAHARVASVQGETLKLGPDTVLSIFGPPERGFGAALGSTKAGSLFALCPMPKETQTFGMAALPVAEPRTGVEPVWSLYPNGADPAPIAASQGRDRLYVARVRPSSPVPKAPMVLEVGTVDSSGAFVAAGLVDVKHGVWDLAVLGEDSGLWIAYADNAHTSVVHLSCK